MCADRKEEPMRRTISSCVALLVTLVSTAASADFAERGTFSISADRLFGVYLTQVHWDPDGADSQDVDTTEIGLLWQGGRALPYTRPRANIDYFVIDHLSIGGTIAYYNVAGDNDGLYADEGSSFLFGPRVGGAWMFNDWAGIWPRGGINYYSMAFGNDTKVWQLTFTAEAAFVLSPWENFAFTVGPAFDIGMAGKLDYDGPGPDYDYPVHAHSFGLLSVGVMGYFNL